MSFGHKTSKKIILAIIKSEISKGNFYKTTENFYMDSWDNYIIPIKKINMEIILSTHNVIIGTNITVICDGIKLCSFTIFSRKYYNMMKRIETHNNQVKCYESIRKLEKFTRGY
ncbi:MAG: hypothetical protein [Caudoviricetes sp.]|nr:MAG: hypothetical protein [Caudoviricetes sp.]